MSDWRFASIGGYLTWSNSDDPEDEQYLYSELSPTLIVGHQEKGDVFPVDYIKLTGVDKAIRVSDLQIDLTKKDDEDFVQTIVAPTKAEADEWYKMITLALGLEAGGSPASQPAQAPKAPEPIPVPKAVEPKPDIQPQSHRPNEVPQPVAVNRRDESPVYVPPPQKLETPIHTPLAATQQPRKEPVVPVVPIRQEVPPPVRQQPAPAAVAPQKWDEPRTVQPAPAPTTSSNTYQNDTYDPNHEIRTTTTTTYDDVRSGGMDPREKARQWMDEQKDDPSKGKYQSSGSGQAAAPGWQSRPGQGAAAATPVRDATGWASGGGASHKVPDWNNTPGNDSNAFSPVAPSRQADPGMFDAQQAAPNASTWGTSNNNNNIQASSSGKYAPNDRDAGFVPTPIAPGRYAQDNNSSSNFNNNRSGGVGGYNNSNNNAAASSADLRKRSGMFVNVPPNPQMNRHVAPNVSAIWKEWTDPDGILYVYHEPTLTMHRRVPGATDFETLVEGQESIPEDDLKHHPYFDELGDTFCDMNGNVVRNVQNYGNQRIDGEIVAASPDLYRTDLVTSPRGQYSPSRRARVSALLPAPRDTTGHYEGRRVHQLVLSTGADASESVITHQIQPLGVSGLMWDPKTGRTLDTKDNDGTNPRNIGPTTLQKQWEHVRHILIQGRYFKKHALKNNSTAFRFCFLTGDNAYVVCVPTSEVMLNVHTDPQTFNSVQDSIQYYGPQSRAIPLNTVTRVSLGSEEDFVVRRKGVNASSTFCIVSRTHAFILECNNPKEAKYFADAWTFFLYHSKPLLPHKNKTPQMKRPITHGTRTGIAF